MAEPPSHEELARRWLALWQDQFVAAAADPALAEAVARLMTLAGAAVSPWVAAIDAAARAHERQRDDAAKPGAGTEAAGAPPVAAPPDDRGDALAELARRLGAVEERLADLEAGARRGRARSPIATRRRRP